MLHSDPQQLLLTILGLIAADGWPRKRKFLMQHPELLTDDTLELLQWMIDEAIKLGEKDASLSYRFYRLLLVKCRLNGVKTTFKEFAKKFPD